MKQRDASIYPTGQGLKHVCYCRCQKMTVVAWPTKGLELIEKGPGPFLPKISVAGFGTFLQFGPHRRRLTKVNPWWTDNG
ncbi:hypothetical protein TNIN_98681 [Trichonephila inaurata madagascariensis]|uniref:Uncharacterized protein n=1 Tax=Trichonephila inaurata madagascariensis TaxID=2747483 RepID=A0A8X6YIJ8_9ARAC|nr:hypothetical protein TNIN_98681 [Trichonephila inaurata madagascariensis]